jgi:hypothetical protein
MLLSAAAPGQRAITEYEVKAAYLYNFAQFVEWPADAFGSANEPLTICIAGDNVFDTALSNAIGGKTVSRRSLAVREIADLKQHPKCHVVFVSSTETRRMKAVLAEFRGRSVLTVGESEDFLAAGGIVNLKLHDGRVRFDISVKAAEAAGLRISSKLLRLAENIRKE